VCLISAPRVSRKNLRAPGMSLAKCSAHESSWTRSCIVFIVALASRGAASADSQGQLFITKDRLGTGGQLDRASLARVREIHMVWPSEDSGNDYTFWMINYAAFFQQPLGDLQAELNFWDVT
jgi:hypothetical protein